MLSIDLRGFRSALVSMVSKLDPLTFPAFSNSPLIGPRRIRLCPKGTTVSKRQCDGIQKSHHHFGSLRRQPCEPW
jgi:hypothetical protein